MKKVEMNIPKMQLVRDEVVSTPMTGFHTKNHTDFGNDEVWSEVVEEIWDRVEYGLGTGYTYWGNLLRLTNWMRYVDIE